MLAELGTFALTLALLFALLQATAPALGVYQSNQALMALARPAVAGQTLFIAIAYLILTICFLRDDFSVLYVANNASQELPFWYKLTAVWGGHEGSMLLWVFVLALWTWVVSYFSQTLPEKTKVLVLVVLAWVSVGFLLFLLLTSQPFERLLPDIPDNGRDLNPLLQDVGFLMHPPLLYMGYVGFAVPFALAIAALIEGKLDASWARWMRPWTLVAWGFLTLGIMLGSWWAYRELGWGGWWFWDPVENASLLPWLAGTALIHSLIVAEKRDAFKGWTLLLAISAFSLSLLGTFLVRSGVLTSVHAFAVDPTRGLFMLVFLLVCIGFSLTLYAWRATAVSKPARFALLSRETCLLLNNVLLTVVLLTILLGTLYPLLIDALGLGKLSVGAPYFNAVFVPLMAPCLFVMGLGPHAVWREMSPALMLKRLRFLFLLSLVLGVGLPWVLADHVSFLVALGLVLAFWLILTTVYDTYLRARRREGTVWQKFQQLSLSHYAMMVAHLGVAVCVIGITVSSAYSIERDVRMAPNESLDMGHYRLTFLRTEPIAGANYQGVSGLFNVYHRQKKRWLNQLYPTKKHYPLSQVTMTKSAIRVGLLGDVYVALGEPLDGDAWAVRVYYKPMVRWIWAGGAMVALGAVLAVFGRRRVRREVVC